MSPAIERATALLASFPRVSGDEPATPPPCAPWWEFSPRERG